MMTLVGTRREHCGLVAPIWLIFINLLVAILVFILVLTIVFALVLTLVFNLVFNLAIIPGTVFDRASVILATLRSSMGPLCCQKQYSGNFKSYQINPTIQRRA